MGWGNKTCRAWQARDWAAAWISSAPKRLETTAMPAAPDPFNWARLLGPMPPMATAGMETEAQMPPSSSGVRRWGAGLGGGGENGPHPQVVGPGGLAAWACWTVLAVAR